MGVTSPPLLGRSEVISGGAVGKRLERSPRDESCRVSPMSILAFPNDYLMTIHSVPLTDGGMHMKSILLILG